MTGRTTEIAAFINKHWLKMPASMIGRQVAQRFPEAGEDELRAAMRLAETVWNMDADEAASAALAAHRAARDQARGL